MTLAFVLDEVARAFSRRHRVLTKRRHRRPAPRPTVATLPPASFALAREHYVLVDVMLTKMRMAHRHDADILRSAGLEGLLDASRTFDPRVGGDFGGWARQKIRWAIREESRRLDPRSRRDRRNGVACAHVDVADVELADGLPLPEDVASAREEIAIVQRLAARLPAVQRELVLGVAGGATLEQAAGGLSRSWACRLHAEAVERLRREVAAA